MLHPDDFLSLMLPVSQNRNVSTERLVAPSPDVSRPFLIQLFFSEASLPPLRVNLTHFALSYYKRALRLPTFFPISGLARLGVKPRLCRSSWRVFAFTHPLIHRSTSPKEALLACPSSPPWNLPSFTLESTFPLHAPVLIPSLVKVRLSPTLTLSHLTIRYFGQMAVFLLAKAALAYLTTALSVVLRPHFPFQQAQYAQVFSLKPAPFCKPFAVLVITNKSATSLLLLSDSRSVLATLFSPPSFLFPQSI